LAASNTVTFAPEGAYGQFNGQNVFTHGVEVGLVRAGGQDLREATDEFIGQLARSNPNMSQASGYSNASVSGRRGLHASLRNVSEATGEPETIQVITTQTRDGNLFYTVAVAPQDEARTYQSTFQQVVKSIRITD